MALQHLEAKKSTDLGGPCPELGSQRKGRDLQRYTREHERLVAGCIPIRWREGSTLQDVEVLMVTSSGGRGLVFPKGGWETDETVAGAAARETLEEAGVRGIIEEPSLGSFAFHSSKVARLHNAVHGRCIAHMFAMRVEEVLPVWPEQKHRERVWVPLLEACNRCKHQWMRDALQVWIQRQSDDSTSCSPANGDVTSMTCPAKKIAASS